MKKTIFFLLLVCCSVALRAQQADSLTRVVKLPKRRPLQAHPNRP